MCGTGPSREDFLPLRLMLESHSTVIALFRLTVVEHGNRIVRDLARVIVGPYPHPHLVHRSLRVQASV